jgi:hypothetical protein
VHPEQAETKDCNQVLPDGAEVTAGAPKRNFEASGCKYCFQSVTASLGVRFD